MKDPEIKNPKAFISYSWSNQDHENLILEIAERLRGDGVDVILDKWDFKEGHDKYAFMQKMVTDPEVNKVLVFSDRIYMGAMLFLVEIPGSPKIFSLQDH